MRSRAGVRKRGTMVGVLMTTIAVLALGMTSAAARADESLKYTLDRGVIRLGPDTWAKIVDQDLTPPDAPATIYAHLTEAGAVSASVTEFTFPVKKITNLQTGNVILPAVDAKIDITASGPITGTFDRTTGSSALNVPAQAVITVYPAGEAIYAAKCKVSGFAFDLATTGSVADPGDPSVPRAAQTYSAAPFAPPSGAGALLATWAGLPATTTTDPGLGPVICGAVDGLIGGPGALHLAGTAIVGAPPPPATAPVKEPTLSTTPPLITTVTDAQFAFAVGAGETQAVTGFECQRDGAAFTPCSAASAQTYSGLAVGKHTFGVRAVNAQGQGPAATYGWTINKGPDAGPDPPGGGPTTTAKLGAVKVSLKPKSVKHGKKATATVKVTNSGSAAAKGVKLCLTVSKKVAKGAKCFSIGTLAAGKSVTKKFSITVGKKVKRGKKVSLSFKASATGISSKTAKASVKVK